MAKRVSRRRAPVARRAPARRAVARGAPRRVASYLAGLLPFVVAVVCSKS